MNLAGKLIILLACLKFTKVYNPKIYIYKLLGSKPKQEILDGQD
jgi:hypothetical protein